MATLSRSTNFGRRPFALDNRVGRTTKEDEREHYYLLGIARRNDPTWISLGLVFVKMSIICNKIFFHNANSIKKTELFLKNMILKA